MREVVSRRGWVTGQVRGSSQGTLEPWSGTSLGRGRHKVSRSLPRTLKSKALCEAVDSPEEMEAFSTIGLRQPGPRLKSGKLSSMRSDGW